jgi:hypothetical protein
MNHILLFYTHINPLELTDQVKKLWGVDKNISFAKKTNADKWI